jgi:hypothetical protein
VFQFGIDAIAAQEFVARPFVPALKIDSVTSPILAFWSIIREACPSHAGRQDGVGVSLTTSPLKSQQN